MKKYNTRIFSFAVLFIFILLIGIIAWYDGNITLRNIAFLLSACALLQVCWLVDRKDNKQQDLEAKKDIHHLV